MSLSTARPPFMAFLIKATLSSFIVPLTTTGFGSTPDKAILSLPFLSIATALVKEVNSKLSLSLNLKKETQNMTFHKLFSILIKC